MAVPQPNADLDENLFCPVCEYNLTGLARTRCPECGEDFDREALRRASSLGEKPTPLWLVAVYFLVLPAIVACTRLAGADAAPTAFVGLLIGFLVTPIVAWNVAIGLIAAHEAPMARPLNPPTRRSAESTLTILFCGLELIAMVIVANAI